MGTQKTTPWLGDTALWITGLIALLILLRVFFYSQGVGTLYQAEQNGQALYVRTYEGREYFALACNKTLPNGLGNSVQFTAIGPLVVQCEFFGWIDDFGPLP